jgi:ABC-type nickel/cobalt efflux system permease component RcnA
MSRQPQEHNAPEPTGSNSFITKITIYQQQLKQKMASLIRQAESSGNTAPLLAVMLMALGYGMIHAAGPGHGKAVAMSYMMSRKPSLSSGLLFGTLTAFCHGLSGVVCVLGLYFILKKSVSGTLADISHVTQIVSFALITLLGLGILASNGRRLFFRAKPAAAPGEKKSAHRYRNMLPWAVAVGLVPCPGVVMIMLFCLSLEVLPLGLLLAGCISAGMALTIALVVTAVVLGKAGIIGAVPQKRTKVIEGVFGMLSGTAVICFGILFLLATLNTPG